MAGAHGLSLTLQQTQTTTSVIAARIHTVVIDNEIGSVKLAPGAPTSVVATRHWLYLAPTVAQSVHAGVLTIRTTCPNNAPLNNCAVDLTLAVPANVTVHADGGVAEMATSGIKGDQTLTTDVGEVVVDHAGGSTLRLSSGVGDVQVSATQTPALVSATSQTGDVKVVVPAGTYNITATSETGDVSVQGLTNNPAAPNRIVATTQTGDVTLRS
jgi:hypothetical protein